MTVAAKWPPRNSTSIMLAFYAEKLGLRKSMARNELADTLMSLDLYNDALVELDRSLEFTGESQDSSEALYLKGKSLKEMNRYEEAIEALTLSLSLYPDPDNLSINLIDEIYTLQGLSDDIEYFNKQVMKNSDNAVAFYFRGLAHLRLGNETDVSRFTSMESCCRDLY